MKNVFKKASAAFKCFHREAAKAEQQKHFDKAAVAWRKAGYMASSDLLINWCKARAEVCYRHSTLPRKKPVLRDAFSAFWLEVN